MITVYGITDQHGQIRYVGMTGNPKQRFARHRSTQKSFEVCGMAILAVKDEWDEDEEAKWIDFFGMENLVNATDGRRRKDEIDWPDEPMAEVECALLRCSRKFVPAREWQVFCTKQCHDDHHNAARAKLVQWARKQKRVRHAP